MYKHTVYDTYLHWCADNDSSMDPAILSVATCWNSISASQLLKESSARTVDFTSGLVVLTLIDHYLSRNCVKRPEAFQQFVFRNPRGF